VSDATVLVAGLPESGKTTSLAALFHLLRNGAPNEAGLALAELPEEREYLMEVESVWLRFEPLERTVAPSPGQLAIPATRGGESVTLSIPDVRGEDVEHLWEYGVATEHLVSIARVATGVLLFVRADDVRPVEFLDENPHEVDASSFRLEDWNPLESPTQTKLCDVLEQLGIVRRGVPIAVVVSAWDMVDSGETPDGWLQRTLPLLWQFLETSASQMATFGISAQGGDVKNSAAREALARLPTTIDRIANPSVRRGDDLTAPLSWLIAKSL
jgi:Double-GTPase 1